MGKGYWTRIVLAFIVLALSLPSIASAAQPQGTVHIRIQTANGSLIPNSSVTMHVIGQYTSIYSNFGDGDDDLTLSPGMYKFSASAVGYEASDEQAIVVEAGTRKTLTFTLAVPAAAGTIYGRVIDKRTGVALSMVEVGLRRGIMPVGGTIRSAADGSFSFRQLPPGTYTVATGSGSDEYTVDEETVEVKSGGSSDVSLAVVRRSRITAVVTTPGGAVANGAQLFVVRESDEFVDTGMGFGSPETDTTVSLPPGEYTVTAGGQAYVTSVPQKVTVLPGETVHLAFVVTPLPAGRVQGKLVNTEGRPIAGGFVSLHDADGKEIGKSAMTGADGSFTFDPVAPGTFRVHAFAWGYNARGPVVIVGDGTGWAGTVTVEAGKTATIDLTLKRQVLLRVQVQGSDGRTVPGAYLLVNGKRVESQTDDDDRFILHVDEGDLLIAAKAPGYKQSADQQIHIGAPGDPTTLTIRLDWENVGAVKGRVIAPNGGGGVTGVAGMQVELRRVGDGQLAVPVVTTGPDGSFVFAEVEPGEYEVVGQGDGAAAGPVRIKVRKGATVRPTLKVRSQP